MSLFDVASTLKQDVNGLRLRQGVITVAPGNGTCSLTLGGSTVQIAGVRHMASYTPVVGHTVWAMTDGRDLFVLGRLQPLT